MLVDSFFLKFTTIVLLLLPMFSRGQTFAENRERDLADSMTLEYQKNKLNDLDQGYYENLSYELKTKGESLITSLKNQQYREINLFVSKRTLNVNKIKITTTDTTVNRLYNQLIDSLNRIFIMSWNKGDSVTAGVGEIRDSIFFLSPTIICGQVHYQYSPKYANHCCWDDKYFICKIQNGKLFNLQPKELFMTKIDLLYMDSETKIYVSKLDSFDAQGYDCLKLGLLQNENLWHLIATPYGFGFIQDKGNSNDQRHVFYNEIVVGYSTFKKFIKPEYYNSLTLFNN